MEPTPPRKPKPESRPFYDIPDHLPTSSKIISEARSSLRILKTRRPCTPKQDERTLFGKASSRQPENRPPSAFSLGSRHFDGSESRPVSGSGSGKDPTTRPHSGTRLTPLDVSPKSSTDFNTTTAPRPPADPNRPIRHKSSKTRLQHSTSIDGKIEENHHIRTKSGSLSDVTHLEETNNEMTKLLDGRRVHSGPTERTQHLIEESGVGNGTETIGRPPSSVSVSSNSDLKRDRSDSGYDTRQGSGKSSSRQGSGSSSHGLSGSRGIGSSGKREEESPKEAEYYNQHIGPLIEEMQTLSKDKDAEKVVELSNELYKVLENGNMLGRVCKRRSAILKTIFKLLDTTEPKTLLAVGRLILALKVTGNNLNSVCRLLFKVGKEERNDSLFMEDNILELMLETAQNTSPSNSADALVYCLGALKFLSSNMTVSKQLAAKNCLQSVASVLDTIQSLINEGVKASQQLSNVLVQATFILRNMADVNVDRTKFISLSIIRNLAAFMNNFPADFDLVLNIVRIFSKLTMHSDCCLELSNQPNVYKHFLQLLTKHTDKNNLVVRICFVLGNLTAKREEARTSLFGTRKCIETLQSVFKSYLESNLQLMQNTCENEEEQKHKLFETEEVLIKLIRLIANLSIEEEIGHSLATNKTLVSWLLQIIDIKDVMSSEELVLNTIATINNLSYYSIENSAITQKQTELATCLMKLLLTDHLEGMVEASRVFGNLTRQKSVRDLLAKNKVNEIMVTLLDSGSREVVYTVCGVLINLMADEDKRGTMKQENGIKKLIEVLRDFGRNDWQLSSMVCQILWNYSIKIKSSNDCFGDQETSDLIELLIEYLDEEAALDMSLSEDLDTDMKDYMRDVWQCDFCPVASQLLSKVETHQSHFEPLEQPI